MKKEIDYCKCPYCKASVEIDIEFAIKNERIFCGGCCKAFDIKVQRTDQDTKEEPSDIEKMLLEKHFERKEADEGEKEELAMEEHASTFNSPFDWDDYDGSF